MIKQVSGKCQIISKTFVMKLSSRWTTTACQSVNVSTTFIPGATIEISFSRVVVAGRQYNALSGDVHAVKANLQLRTAQMVCRSNSTSTQRFSVKRRDNKRRFKLANKWKVFWWYIPLYLYVTVSCHAATESRVGWGKRLFHELTIFFRSSSDICSAVDRKEIDERIVSKHHHSARQFECELGRFYQDAIINTLQWACRALTPESWLVAKQNSRGRCMKSKKSWKSEINGKTRVTSSSLMWARESTEDHRCVACSAARSR